MSAQPDIRICEDAAALAQQTTDIFVRLAQESVAARGRFTVALAGGSTPQAAYAMLASAAYRDRLPWQQTHFFWGDERHVPPEHEDSNTAWRTKPCSPKSPSQQTIFIVLPPRKRRSKLQTSMKRRCGLPFSL